MNVDIKNIASKKEPFWRSIYEVIDDLYFEVVNCFQKYNPNEPQNILSAVKADFKKWLWNICCMHNLL